jgi:hypothetical protein
MATLDSNKVTGVSVVSDATDAANKSYIDTLNYGYESPTGNSGKFLSGYPGTTYWQLRTGSVSNTMGGDTSYGNAIAYGNDVYAVAGQDGAMQTSTDTITWSLRTAGFRTTLGTAPVIAVIYANNIFVACGFQGILNTSTDAIVWTLRTTVNSSNENLSLTYLNGIYLAGTVGGVISSTNAIDWQLRTSAITNQIYSVGAGPNLYLAGSQTDASISASTDTINWSLRTSGISSQDIRSISYGNGIYLVSGSSANTLISSTDTIQWTLRTTGFETDIIYSLLYVYDTGSYIAFGQSGRVHVSTNGISWTIRTTNTTNDLYGSAYGNDIIIAGGANGSIVIPAAQQYWQSINSTSTSASDRVSYKGYTEFTSSGTQTYYIPSSASQFYIEVIGAGGGGSSGKLTPSVLSGGGGGGGAYNSWLIRRGELGNAETITVVTGAKGIGGTTPTAGGNTTLTWTGNSTSGTTTYTLTSLGGNAASNDTAGSVASIAASTLNPRYGAQGGSGAAGNTTFNTSNNITQSQRFQITGGGGGGFVNNDGGYSRTYYYGNIFTANGGISGGDAENGISGSYTGSYGSGGGGGGALFSGFTYWQQKNSRFGSTSINSISGYTTPIYISVGNSGTLTTSTNSHHWTLRTSGFSAANITHIIFGNIHIASGDVGRLTASTNGISWRLRTSGFGTTNINALTYFNGEYLIGGRNETVSWTFRTSGNLSNLLSSYFASNTFIIGYDQGSLISSTNSVEWSSRTSGFGTSSINAISFFNGEFLIGGRKDLGQIWTLRTSGFGTSTINNLFYTSVGGDLYISAGSVASPTSRLLVSTDGIAWTLRTTGISTSTAISSIVKLNYFNGEYLLGGRIESITWTLRTSGLNLSNALSLTGATYSNGEFLVAGQSPTVSWTLRTVVGSTTTRASAFGGPSNLFLLGNSTGVLQVSTDGISWQLRTAGFGTSRIDSISCSDGITPPFYIISGGAGRLSTSTDSIHWTSRTTGFGTTTIYTVFSGAGFCVAAGGGAAGRVSASTDGINWAARTVASTTLQAFDGIYTQGPNGTASTNNYFITSASPSLRHSTDTIIWRIRTVGTLTQIGQVGTDRAIAYGNSIYLFGTITGTLHSSTDTIHWTLRTGPSDLSGLLPANTINYGNGVFIVGATSGFTASSTNAIIWTLRTSGFGTSAINTSTYSSTNDTFVIAGDAAVGSGTSYSVITQGNGALLVASTDTVNWTIRTTPIGYEAVVSTVNGTTFVGGNSSGAIGILNGYMNTSPSGLMSSTDNINWLLRTVGFSTGSPLIPITVGYANNLYFAGSSSGTSNFIATSTDTIQWTLRTVANIAISSNNPTIYGYGNGLYVASFASNGAPWLATSTDAISWIIRTFGIVSTAFVNVTSFAYGNVFVGPTYVIGTLRGSPGIASSTDTIHWTLRTSGLTSGPRDLKFDGVFVVTSNLGSTATSTNGIFWTLRTSGLESISTGIGLAENPDSWISAYSNLQILASTQNTISQLGNGAFLRASTDTISWVTRSTAPNIVDISAIGVGPSHVLATGNTYASPGNPYVLMASTNNIVWTLRTTNTNSTFTSSILYSDVDNLYLIAGSTTNVRVSTDTIHWVARTSGIIGQQIGPFGTNTFSTDNAFIYENGIYMFGTTVGSIVTSTNSIEWTLRTSGLGTTSVNTIAYGNGAFIIGGTAGIHASSTDGIAWTLRTSGFGTTAILSSVFGNGTYLMGGSAGVLVSSTQDLSQIIGGALLRSSTNSVAWTTRVMHPTSFEIDAMGSSDSYTVAAGIDISSTGFINVSTDNTNWTARTSVPNVSAFSGGFAYGSPSGTSYYLLPTGNIGLSSLIASTDTISWRIRTVPSMLAGDDVTYGNGIFVLVGDTGKLATSTNSIEWVLRTSGMGTGSEAFNTVKYNDGIYVASAGSSSGLTSVSTDAITWIARTTGFGVSKINTIAVGNNIWIIGGTGGNIQSSTQQTLTQFGDGALLRASTDSIAWTTRTTGKNTVQITELQYGDQGSAAGQHSLASGLNYIGQNFLIASTDNIIWTERTTGFGSSILSLGYGGGIYLMSGNGGSLLTTTNTIAWTFRTSGFGSSSIISITYGSGYYVVASATSIAYSTNAIQWEIKNPGFGFSSINTITYQNDSYLAGGTGGSLAVSYPGLDTVIAGKGGDGTRGGGGGGGAVVNVGVGSFGVGGNGGDGYVKITWW